MRIAVIGDLLIDNYIWCVNSGISPDAPTLKLQKLEEEKRPGGAGNVIENLCSLNQKKHTIHYFGYVGEEYIKVIKTGTNSIYKNIETSNSIQSNTDHSHPVKTRFIIREPYQQVLRVDKTSSYRENCSKIKSSVIESLEKEDQYDFGVVADYRHGAISQKLLSIIRRKSNLLIIDPKRKFSSYKDCDIIVPNLNEFNFDQRLTGGKPSIKELVKAIKKLETNKGPTLILKLGPKGCLIIDIRKENLIYKEIKAYRNKQKVIDATGAGDTFLATLTIKLAEGKNIEEAVYYANKMAGISTTYPGCWIAPCQ